MSIIEVWRIRHLFVAEVNAMLSAVSVTEGELQTSTSNIAVLI